MTELRKIVLILGNGFDLDLGLKTSYKDFWESEFCPKDYPAPLIRHLNSKWTEDIDDVRWYDLENELLLYAKTGNKADLISNEEREYIARHSDYDLSIAATYTGIDGVFFSLQERGIIKMNSIRRATIPFRKDLLEHVEWRDRKALGLIKDGLCKYLDSIKSPVSQNKTVAYQTLLAIIKSAEFGDKINIFTFNYTRLQMCGHELIEIPVHYMHGSCEEGKIILGTRDDRFINERYDYLMKSMDESYCPPDIVSALNDADEVIVFGHSLGENDVQYFAPFFLRQSNHNNAIKKEITLFTRDTNSEIEIKRVLFRSIGRAHV